LAGRCRLGGRLRRRVHERARPAPPSQPTALAGYYAQRLDWQPCDGGFQCAQLVVPFDYAKPDGPRFTLPVVKLAAADPSERIGALVVNPGGPLGESQLTYLGKSYGTYLGAWYAQLFPHRVRALVLDGAVDPDTSSLQATIAQAHGFQVAFGSFAAWCLASGGCPFRPGSSVAAAAAQVEALIARANSVPLANHLGDRQVADGAMLLTGVADALYSRSFWPVLRTALASAFGGDGTGLLELANQLYERNASGTYSNLAVAVTAIDCLDRPWPRSLGAWQSAASAATRAAPMFGEALVWGSLTCAYWPVPSYPLPRIRAAGAPPILVVGTLRDPATPYRWAQALASDLSSGVLLGWNGDGHTAYGEGSACVDTIVNDYLINLAVPRSGTVCQH
jgi:pimeloyl-ACP methyl ester carboxylesterase